ncbi:hypothetical protein [Deinococcus hopiensis]|uniref:hypothetical protein n=1 Tax=Deinococcus hopiensis TaxID=309885 RepID=UPI001FE4DB75|nr:hypothetical protein [Deinococcus hopiensis]
MTEPDFAALARRLEAQLPRSWPVTGGASALEVRLGGEVRRWVVRQYGAATSRQTPRWPGTNFSCCAFSTRLACPSPLPARGGRPVCHSSPLVTAFVEGQTVLEPEGALHLPEELADFLLRLHALIPPPEFRSWLPPRPAPGHVPLSLATRCPGAYPGRAGASLASAGPEPACPAAR